jgi:hypothetical protein
MGRDPSYDAEKLALGGIAILLVETAILCNFRQLQMQPRCGTIFLVAQTLVCVDEIKIKFDHKISARIFARRIWAFRRNM